MPRPRANRTQNIMNIPGCETSSEEQKQQESNSEDVDSGSMTSSSDPANGNEKPKRMKTKREYVERIVVTPSHEDMNEVLQKLLFDGYKAEKRLIFIKKNEEELAEHRRGYRKDYQTRPHVKVKNRKRLEDPEVKKKRKEYSDRDDVKERKKKLAKVNREMRNKLKEANPDLYVDLRGKAAEHVGVKI